MGISKKIVVHEELLQLAIEIAVGYKKPLSEREINRIHKRVLQNINELSQNDPILLAGIFDIRSVFKDVIGNFSSICNINRKFLRPQIFQKSLMLDNRRKANERLLILMRNNCQKLTDVLNMLQKSKQRSISVDTDRIVSLKCKNQRAKTAGIFNLFGYRKNR